MIVETGDKDTRSGATRLQMGQGDVIYVPMNYSAWCFWVQPNIIVGSKGSTPHWETSSIAELVIQRYLPFHTAYNGMVKDAIGCLDSFLFLFRCLPYYTEKDMD